RKRSRLARLPALRQVRRPFLGPIAEIRRALSRGAESRLRRQESWFGHRGTSGKSAPPANHTAIHPSWQPATRGLLRTRAAVSPASALCIPFRTGSSVRAVVPAEE